MKQRKGKERKRPSSVSDKYADKYAEFQEAKKNGTLGKDKFGKTMGWNDFRDGKGVGGTPQNGLPKKNALGNIQPPSPPANGKQTENPANEAGGKAENKKEDEIIRILKENQETLKKYDETIKNIEQNTATLAISKNSKD